MQETYTPDNHGYFDHGKKLNIPNYSPHSGRKMATIPGTPLNKLVVIHAQLQLYNVPNVTIFWNNIQRGEKKLIAWLNTKVF